MEQTTSHICFPESFRDLSDLASPPSQQNEVFFPFSHLLFYDNAQAAASINLTCSVTRTDCGDNARTVGTKMSK